MATIQYLDNGNPDGTVLGHTSAELLAFWGATPAAQSAFTNPAVSTSAAVSVCGLFAFTASQANGIIAMVNELRALLVTVGLSAD